MNKEQKTALIGGGAVVVVATTIFAVAFSDVPGDRDADSKRTTKVAASTEATPSPSPSQTGPQSHGLSATADWGDVVFGLSDFRRGSTGKYGVPKDTDYVRFTATVTNNGKIPFALDDLLFNCTTDEILDYTNKLDGAPDVHVMPGKSLKWELACAQGKKVTELQFEVNPQIDGEQTAVFLGTVR